LAASLALARPTIAQPEVRDPIAAEALFERGKHLMESGQTAEACAAFAESQRLDPAGGTLLRLALCREAEGKLATAWLAYLEVERNGHLGSDSVAQERTRIARKQLSALERRVPKLRIDVGPPARALGLSVAANGLPRNEGTWGVFLPVDPGEVEIVASAPGRREYRVTVHLAEGQERAVDIPALTTDAPAVSSAGPASPASKPDLPPSRTSMLRPAGLAVGILGVAAIGAGTYFGVHAIQTWNDANAVCPNPSCPSPSGVALANDAQNAARLADVTLAVGAAGVVAGAVLFFLGAPENVQARPAGIAIAF
jgi:hypothetical protein